MSDDWKPGDLALCVKGGVVSRVGQIYTVDNVEMLGSLCLWFVGQDYSGLLPSFAKNFRKIRPHTPDEQDAETIRLLTGAPVKEPIHA